MKIGFIGAGNMGGAMIDGMLDGGFTRDEILIYGKAKGEEFACARTMQTASNEAELVRACDIVVLAIKPAIYEATLGQIKGELADKIIISLAPNFSIERVRASSSARKIVRAMPNTPARVKCATTALCFDGLNEKEKARVSEIFASFGRTYEIAEAKFAIFTAISGSLPAMIFSLIESASDAAVRGGISRDMAHDIIAHAVAGSAGMLTATREHPSVLKDAVCSPAGTTIEMIATLDKMGFSAAIIEAIKACEEKAKG